MVHRFVHSRFGPILSSLVLSMMSTPFVAASISTSTASPWESTRIHFPPPLDPLAAAPIALLAVLSAGLVGGAVAGLIVRRSPVAGLLLALFVAWPVAIAALPIIPTLRGGVFEAGYECLDSCSAIIHAGDLLSGAAAYGEALLIGALFVVPILIVVVLLAAAVFAGRKRLAPVAATFGLGAFLALNFVSVQQGGLALACLLAGAGIWVAPYWADWQRAQPRPAPAPPGLWPALPAAKGGPCMARVGPGTGPDAPTLTSGPAQSDMSTNPHPPDPGGLNTPAAAPEATNPEASAR